MSGTADALTAPTAGPPRPARPAADATVPQNRRPSVIVFAIGMTLTTATQMRVPGMPVGIGETLLLFWALGSDALLWRSQRRTRLGLPEAIGGFWLLAGLALAAGGLTGMMLRRAASPQTLLHDLMAFVFTAFITLSFVAAPELAQRVRRTMSWFLVFSVLPLVLVVASRLRHVGIGPLSFYPWYGFRFAGWAQNPNQLALHLVLAPFFAFALTGLTDDRRRRRVLQTLGVLAVIPALLGQSDALVLAWAMAGAILTAMAWGRLAFAPPRTLARTASAFVIIPCLVLLALGILGQLAQTELAQTALAVYSEGGQGSLRVTLWEHGLQAFATSPLVGLGPGAHSGVEGPFLDFEAHNTFIDWASSTGLVGIAAYLALLGWCAGRLVAHRALRIAIGLLVLVTFSSFHYTMRQPVFWYYLVSLAVWPDLMREARDA